jgi:hypothetical protein
MENRKDSSNEPKGTAATASKMAASKKPAGGAEPPSMGKGATSTGQGAATPNAGEQDLLQHAKDTTGEIVNQVQQQAGTQLNRQKESAATELSTVVNAVRRFGETLTTEGNGPIARYAAQYGDKAADSLERLTTYIREKDPKELLNDVQNFGRRQPALLLGGAFLLGFAGARLIRSSIDAGTQGSSNTGAQRSLNTGAQRSNYTGTQPQSYNTNVPATQPSRTPNAL